MGENSFNEVIQARQKYLTEHEERLIAYCEGDESVLFRDDMLRSRILGLYKENVFGGYSLSEMLDKLKLPDGLTSERIKKIIGGLLADKLLEYVDYRCYRVYPRFQDAFQQCI